MSKPSIGAKRSRDQNFNDDKGDLESFFGEISKEEQAMKKKQQKVEEVIVSKPPVSAPQVSSKEISSVISHPSSSSPVRPKLEFKEEIKSGASSSAVAAHHAPLEFDTPSESLLTSAQGSIGSHHNNQYMQDNFAQRDAPLREAAGKKWKDTSLLEWPENDYRLFVGNLDKETRLDQLEKAFKHYPSFTMAKLVMNKVPEPNSTVYKCKGFGFASFMDPMDCAKALRLEQGKYCGLRPMQLKRSKWEERNKSSRDEERRRGRS